MRATAVALEPTAVAPPGQLDRGVRVVSPAPRDAWREVLAADGDALASQTPEWVDALCEARFEDASRMYESADGTRIVLPLVRRRAGPVPGLAPQASMPHAWGMGGLVADGQLSEADVAGVARDLASLPALRTSVRPNPLHAGLWAGATDGLEVTSLPRCAHVLELDGGPDEVWQSRFASSARRAVRKAERAGLEVECGSSDRLLDAFQTLLDRSVERWAQAQHEPLPLARLRARRRDPPQKFRSIAAALDGALRVWVAFKDGSPVASIIVLLGADASYTRGAMDKQLTARTAANELLHWRAIREACEAGCGRYHMGETGSSRPLARFKEKLGARQLRYAEYRFERLPLTRADAAARGLVKRVLRFRDA